MILNGPVFSANIALKIRCWDTPVNLRTSWRFAIRENGQVTDSPPYCHKWIQARPMCCFRPKKRRSHTITDEENSAALLGNSVLFSTEYPSLDTIAEYIQSFYNISHGAAAPSGRNAGHIFHDDPLRQQPFHDAEIFTEQAAAVIMKATLVVIDTKSLTGRTANKASSSPFLSFAARRKSAAESDCIGPGRKTAPQWVTV